MPTINPVSAIPVQLKPGDKLGFKVIAVIGCNNDWAAYRGLTDWSDEDTAKRGDKISKDTAEDLFYAPVAAGLKYRGY
ncbi:MAG: hypothetical protein WC341_00560 [Bacteroidales bacterium]|jgi:hypothetical protein